MHPMHHLTTSTLRKLHGVSCPDKYKKKSLEKRYPGLCDDVKAVMEAESCQGRWTKEGFGDNIDRRNKFQENILKYMKENIALINVYIKEPYCEVINQDIYMSW